MARRGESGEAATAYGGGRVSAQRADLARAAAAMGVAFTVDDLASAAARDGRRPSLATAYRSVRAMLLSGYLERIGERDGRALYACCDADEHHHHVMCTSCGAVAETACPLGIGVASDAARAGFVLTGHDVVLYGLCRVCAARRGA